MSCAFEAGTEKLDHPLPSLLSCWFFPTHKWLKTNIFGHLSIQYPDLSDPWPHLQWPFLPPYLHYLLPTSHPGSAPGAAPPCCFLPPLIHLQLMCWEWFQFFMLPDTFLLTPPLSHYSSSTFCCLFLFCRAWISWDSTIVTNTKTFTFLLLCSAVVFTCQNPKSHCPNFSPSLPAY